MALSGGTELRYLSTRFERCVQSAASFYHCGCERWCSGAVKARPRDHASCVSAAAVAHPLLKGLHLLKISKKRVN